MAEQSIGEPSEQSVFCVGADVDVSPGFRILLGMMWIISEVSNEH